MASFFQGGCECSKMEGQMNKKAEEAFNLVNLPPFTQETKGGDISGGKKTRKINKFPDGKRFKVNGKSKSKKTLANKLGKMMIGGDGVSVPSKITSALVDVYKQAKEMRTLLEAINKALERSIEESKKDSDKSSYLTAMQSYKKQVNASIKYLDSIINDVTNTDVINEAMSTNPTSNDEIYKLMQAVDDDPNKVNELVATMSNMFSAYVYADELRGSVENGAKLVEELLATNNVGKQSDIKVTLLENISKSNLTSDQQSKLLEVINHFDEHREALKYVSNVEGGAVITKLESDIKMRNSIRKALAVAFVGGLGERLNKIVDNLNFADKFGTSDLPVTDEMTRFGVHLSNISDFADKNALFALIGLNLSPNSLQIKAAYLRSLSNLQDTIDALLRNGNYNSISAQLNSIKTSVSELTSYINSFYDRITSTNDMLKYTKEQIHAAVTPSTTRGGTIEDIRKEMDKVNIDTTILLRINEFMDKFKYRMTLSNVESSMLNSANILDKNSKDYEETLAKLIAKQINELNKERDFYLGLLTKNAAPSEDLTLVRDIYSSKKEFYELVEATELHLKNFNNNVVNKSKEISDLIGLLNKVNFNSDWYTTTNLGYFLENVNEKNTALLDRIKGYMNGIINIKLPPPSVDLYNNKNIDSILGASPLLASILAYYIRYNKPEELGPLVTLNYSKPVILKDYKVHDDLLFINYNVLTVCLQKLLKEFYDTYLSTYKNKDEPLVTAVNTVFKIANNKSLEDLKCINLASAIATVFDEYATIINSGESVESSYYYDDTLTEIASHIINDIFNSSKKHKEDINVVLNPYYKKYLEEIEDKFNNAPNNSIPYEYYENIVLGQDPDQYFDSFEGDRGDSISNLSKLIIEYMTNESFSIMDHTVTGGAIISNNYLRYMAPIIKLCTTTGHLCAYMIATKSLEVKQLFKDIGNNIDVYLGLLIYMNYLSQERFYLTEKEDYPIAYDHYITTCNIEPYIKNIYDSNFIEFNNICVYTYIYIMYIKAPLVDRIVNINQLGLINDNYTLNIFEYIQSRIITYSTYPDVISYPFSAHILDRYSRNLKSIKNLTTFINDTNKDEFTTTPSTKLFLDILNYHDTLLNTDKDASSIDDTYPNTTQYVWTNVQNLTKKFITDQFFTGGKANLNVSNEVEDFTLPNDINKIKSLYKSNALLQNIIEIITKITTNDTKFIKPIEIYRRLSNYIVYSNYITSYDDTANQYEIIQETIDYTSKKINMTHVLKAFCAKLFITLGVFDINNTNTVSSNNFNTVRLLVGGNNEVSQNNTIYSEITELYIRLPLVIALHKNLFRSVMKRDSAAANNSDALTIIPEMTGVYENLLKFMFSYDRIDKDIQYNSSDISFIIRCINDIYLKQKDKYASSSNVSVSIIQDYVNTVNEKYTILDIEQRKRLIDQINNTEYYGNKNYSKGPVPDNASYNQLNGEVGNYTAPSSKYTANTGSSVKYDTVEKKVFSFDKGIPDIFKSFKNIMRQTLIDTSNEVVSLKPLVTEAKRALTLAKSEQEKYNIISKYMQNNQIKSISEYVYDLFLHEMVDVNMTLLDKHISIIDELYINTDYIFQLIKQINRLVTMYDADKQVYLNNIADLPIDGDIDTINEDTAELHRKKINDIIVEYGSNNPTYVNPASADASKRTYMSICLTILLDNILQCTSFSDLIVININKNTPVLNFEKFVTEILGLISIIKTNINILSRVIINNNELAKHINIHNNVLVSYEDKLTKFTGKQKYENTSFSINELNLLLDSIFKISSNAPFADVFHTLVMDSLLVNSNNNSINTTKLFNGLIQLPSYNHLYYYNSNNAPSNYSGSIFKTLNQLIASLLNVSYDKILQKLPPSLFQTLNNNIFNNSGNGTQSKLDVMPDPIAYIKDCIANGSTLVNKNNIIETMKNMGLRVNGDISIKLLDTLSYKSDADSMLVKSNNIVYKLANPGAIVGFDEDDIAFLNDAANSNLASYLATIRSINLEPTTNNARNIHLNPLIIYAEDVPPTVNVPAGIKNDISIPVDATDFNRNVQSGMHSNKFERIPVKHVIPRDDTILYYSLSELIKHLINTKNDKVDTFKYRADATTSLDMNVQDTIFVNYPIIENMLSILQRKIKNIKLLMSCFEDEQLKFSMHVSDMHLYLPEKTSYTTILKNTPGDEVRNIFNNYFNRANTSISLLLSCINTTLSELNIKSEYFEITNEFNKNYQQMNNMTPLGLISLSTLALRSTLSQSSRVSRMFNPEKSTNDIQKIKRGNRSLLGRLSNSTEDISKNQNIVNILSIFNNTNFDKFDESIFVDSIKATVRNLQYLNNYYNNTVVFSSTNYSAAEMYNDYEQYNYMTKTQNTSLSKYLILIEDTDQSNQLASMFNKKVQVDSNIINMSNIIDLNISPININMLHNEIPGIYLFNYNNIFDINIIQMLRIEDPDSILNGNFDNDTISSNMDKYVLANNLVNPYSLGNTSRCIKHYIEAFVNSDNSIKEFGSAKFLSDVLIPQVFYNMEYIKADTNPNQYNNNYTFSYELMNTIKANDAFNDINMRNLFFLTNLQRVIIYRINKEALKHTSVFTKGLALIDSSNTEFYGKKAYSTQNDKDIYTNSIEDRSGKLRK